MRASSAQLSQQLGVPIVIGLADRGVLKEGACADLTLFDADTVDESGSYAQPIAAARGIETVVVNGEIVWTQGRSTGSRPGRVLKRERGAN